MKNIILEVSQNKENPNLYRAEIDIKDTAKITIEGSHTELLSKLVGFFAKMSLEKKDAKSDV